MHKGLYLSLVLVILLMSGCSTKTTDTLSIDEKLDDSKQQEVEHTQSLIKIKKVVKVTKKKALSISKATPVSKVTRPPANRPEKIIKKPSQNWVVRM